MPNAFKINDNLIEMPEKEATMYEVNVERGPNIKPIPVGKAPEKDLRCELILKVGDDITTDHIMPAGTKVLPYRSNVPKLSEFCFTVCDKEFPARAKEKGGGVILGGANYGQGSSREHAALVPLYLGIKAVVAKSFARIHVANLINFGIVPMTLANPDDYDKFTEGDALEIVGPDTRPFAITAGAMADLEGAALEEPRTPQMRFYMQLPKQVPALTILRRSVDLSPK